MSLIYCEHCGKQLLSGGDEFIYRHDKDGEHYSCGCFEIDKPIGVLVEEVFALRVTMRTLVDAVEKEWIKDRSEYLEDAMRTAKAILAKPGKVE